MYKAIISIITKLVWFVVTVILLFVTYCNVHVVLTQMATNEPIVLHTIYTFGHACYMKYLHHLFSHATCEVQTVKIPYIQPCDFSYLLCKSPDATDYYSYQHNRHHASFASLITDLDNHTCSYVQDVDITEDITQTLSTDITIGDYRLFVGMKTVAMIPSDMAISFDDVTWKLDYTLTLRYADGGIYNRTTYPLSLGLPMMAVKMHASTLDVANTVKLFMKPMIQKYMLTFLSENEMI